MLPTRLSVGESGPLFSGGRFTMRPVVFFSALALAGRYGSSVREFGSGAISTPSMVTNTSLHTNMDALHADISRIRCIIFNCTCGWPPNFIASAASRGGKAPRLGVWAGLHG